MKRISQITSVALFFAFLITAFTAGILRKREYWSFFENRLLAQFPKFSVETVGSGEYFSDVETYLKDHAPGRNTLLKLDTRIKLVRNVDILRCPVVNETVVLDDLLLPFNDYETVSRENIDASARREAACLESVRELTESYGGRFYYVTVPCQYVFYEENYPDYLNSRGEYTRIASECLDKALSTTGVTRIDMGRAFSEIGFSDGMSSKVDNHYGAYGAYLTYLEIMNAVNEDMGYDLDILRREDVEVTEIPNRYLGSRMRKLFGLTDVEERLFIITPIDPVEFSRCDGGETSEATVFKMPENQYVWADYGLYMGGDIAETVIDTGRDELPSILVYGDSFTNAAETLIYYGFDEMHSIDMRYYRDKSLGDYIREYQPEIVVLIRDYEQLVSTDFNGAGVE